MIIIETGDTEAQAICKSALISKGMPRDRVEAMRSGRVMDAFVWLVVKYEMPWTIAEGVIMEIIKACREEMEKMS